MEIIWYQHGGQQMMQHLNNPARADSYFAPGLMYNSTSLRSTIILTPEMRTTPSILCTSASNAYRFYRNGTFDSFDDLSIGGSSQKGCAHVFNSTDISGTAGHAGSMFIAGGSTGFVGLSAEL